MAAPQPSQAQSAEYGLPETQTKATNQGTARVLVPKEVADKFEAAKDHAQKDASGPTVDLATHKSGMETASQRVRNTTEVTQAKVGRGEDTRQPKAGFPAQNTS